jgi:hypothetical protein
MLPCCEFDGLRVNRREVLGYLVTRRRAMGALVFTSLAFGLACSPADISDEEFENQESALARVADGPPRVTTAPTYVVGSVRPVSIGCPSNRFYAIMHVEPEPVLSAVTPTSELIPSVQPASDTLVAVVTCPHVEGYDESNEVNGVCTYDAHTPLADAPAVPGALAIAKCPQIPVKGGGPPDEKEPAINNYYSELDILLVVFRTSELKVQLVRPNQSTLTITSDTTALKPYTKTLSSLAKGSMVRADFVEAPNGWVSDAVEHQ